MRQFGSLGYSLTHLCRDIAWVLPVHLLAQPRGNLDSQTAGGIAPKNIATFNTHTEALEPMAGATFTRYDAPSYARGWRQ